MQDLYQTRKTLIQRIQETRNERSWEEFLCIYEPYVGHDQHNIVPRRVRMNRCAETQDSIQKQDESS